MATKIRKPIAKLSRRLGIVLGKEKVVARRPFPPGVHGPAQALRKPKVSAYGLQLAEKQKAKAVYGMRERQFRRTFDEASNMPGNTADSLVRLLEQRLDNVVFRLGYATTRRQARQMVGHGFFSVNGKKTDVPSYRVRTGDMIALKETKKGKGLIQGLSERMAKTNPPKWLTLNASVMEGKVTGMPEGEDLRNVFDPTMIVEFYSR
jgi:small subunit ribosomal protein S4